MKKFYCCKGIQLPILQSHWSLPLLGNKPKKFNFMHQTVSCWEACVGSSTKLIPYCDEAHAACSWWVHRWNLMSLASFPRPCPAFHHLCSMYCQRWTRAWEQDYSLSTQCESESCLLMITVKKQSPSKFFAVGACLPYIVTTCTKSRIICDYYHTEKTM